MSACNAYTRPISRWLGYNGSARAHAHAHARVTVHRPNAPVDIDRRPYARPEHEPEHAESSAQRKIENRFIFMELPVRAAVGREQKVI